MVLDELEQKSSPQVLLTWKILCVHHPGLNCSSRISCSFQDVSFTRFWQSLEEEGCKMASTCRAACDPSSDMKAWKSQTLTAQGFHLKEMISTHRHGCCRCFSSKRKQHQNPGEAKREWERESMASNRKMHTAVHCGTEPSCQACLDARPRPKITTDLPPKLLMSNISRFPRSLSLLSHMLARPGSQPPLWIWFDSLHCVVMETKIWVLHHFSSVMVAVVRYCNLCSQCRLQRQKQGPESRSAFKL